MKRKGGAEHCAHRTLTSHSGRSSQPGQGRLEQEATAGEGGQAGRHLGCLLRLVRSRAGDLGGPCECPGPSSVHTGSRLQGAVQETS